MNESRIRADQKNLKRLLEKTLQHSLNFLERVDETMPASRVENLERLHLADEGIGAEEALNLFIDRYSSSMTASSGPRYLGFVTGGTTPAALLGDWLVSTFDINLADSKNSSAPNVEFEAIGLLRELFGLTEDFSGVFVSGATMSNFMGLAVGREWIAKGQGKSIVQDGLYNLPKIDILSGEAHSSIYKALSMLGMGRKSVTKVALLPDREAVDIYQLELELEKLEGRACLVVANAGTVNTVDFDDIDAIGKLKEKYRLWLHVDAAFGGFAACSPTHKSKLNGIALADSVTIDAHKWLNVPYDSAMFFTKHRELQTEVFQNSAAYLGPISSIPDFFHLTPENSRRFRALPAWFTLLAYGKNGYREIVERNCSSAAALGQKILGSTAFKLLAPVRLNVVCFTLAEKDNVTVDLIKTFLDELRDDGRVFMTPTVYKGSAGIRAAFCNWRTEQEDVEIIWQALIETINKL
ncbi:MAG: aspartate aminotransferase family protein [Blastocatellia bacterium]|nr:aspartate aminotransferase family protein [Blastocatellia bacterium]